MSSMDIIIGPPKDFLMTRSKTKYHHVVTCQIIKPGEQQQRQRHRLSYPSQCEIIKRVKELMGANGWKSSALIEWNHSKVLEGLWISTDSVVEIRYLLPDSLHMDGLSLLQREFYLPFT